jgi:hypothetical protein
MDDITARLSEALKGAIGDRMMVRKSSPEKHRPFVYSGFGGGAGGNKMPSIDAWCFPFSNSGFRNWLSVETGVGALCLCRSNHSNRHPGMRADGLQEGVSDLDAGASWGWWTRFAGPDLAAPTTDPHPPAWSPSAPRRS